jgi:putative flavoprotein involved in K+ transport
LAIQEHNLDEAIDGNGDRGVLDALVIGGGQAGLAMGYHLVQRGLRFIIVDSGAEVGDVWRNRWDSLKLFTPAQYDNLPGMSFPDASDVYPGKDAVADFLKTYADTFSLPVQLNATVSSLALEGDVYMAKTDTEVFKAKQVVVATGPFQVPFVPPQAKDFDPDVVQLHSVDYRNPASVPEGRILVVGGANTGCQIALELSETHDVEISVGQRLPTIPQRPLGRDVWWWGTKIGLTRLAVASRLGKRLSQRDVVIGGGFKELRKLGVKVQPRLVDASGRIATFESGDTTEVDAVLWATGYRTDHSWIDFSDLKDERGLVKHARGVTPSPGLYLLGLSWQNTRTSALLGWVSQDAEFLAQHIERLARTTRTSPQPVG